LAFWRIFSDPAALTEDGSDRWCPVILATGDGGSTTQVLSFVHETYTMSDLRVKVVASTGGDDGSYFRVRINNTEVNALGILITVSGWFEDLVTTETLTDGDNCFYVFQNFGMHGDDIDLRNGGAMVTFEGSTLGAQYGYGIPTQSNASSWTVMGSVGIFSTAGITNQEHDIQRAMVLSDLSAACDSESSSDFDHSPTKNGTASTSVSVNVTSTGNFEDVTGTEAYAVDDRAAFEHLRTGGAQSADVVTIRSDIEEAWLTCQGNSVTTREYYSFTSRLIGTSPDDEFEMRIGSQSVGHLVARVTSAGGGTTDISARIETTNSTNLTIDGTSSGYLEDLTGSDTVADTNSMVITAAASSGTLVFSFAGLECPWTDPSGGGVTRRVFITSS